MIVELDLDPAVVAQIDTLARRLGTVEVGDDRERKRRSEVVRRLLLMWDSRSEQARMVGVARGELEVSK